MTLSIVCFDPLNLSFVDPRFYVYPGPHTVVNARWFMRSLINPRSTPPVPQSLPWRLSMMICCPTIVSSRWTMDHCTLSIRELWINSPPARS